MMDLATLVIVQTLVVNLLNVLLIRHFIKEAP